jgi:hypothetical protein
MVALSMTALSDKKPAAGPEPSRTDQAREIAKAYADDLREIITKLCKRAPMRLARLEQRSGLRRSNAGAFARDRASPAFCLF